MSRSFQSVTQRTAKKFLQFEHPTARKFLRFYHAAAKKFLRFPGLKLKRPEISRKKNFFLQTQKEVLACALFLGCTVSACQLSMKGKLLIVWFICSLHPYPFQGFQNSARNKFGTSPLSFGLAAQDIPGAGRYNL